MVQATVSDCWFVYMQYPRTCIVEAKLEILFSIVGGGYNGGYGASSGIPDPYSQPQGYGGGYGGAAYGGGYGGGGYY